MASPKFVGSLVVAFGFLALLAVVSVDHLRSDTILQEETNNGPLHVLPADQDPFLMTTRLADDDPKVLRTVMALKAYCELAYDKAQDPGYEGALIHFITRFGKHVEDDFEEAMGGVTEVKPTSVAQYKAVVDELKAHYSDGLDTGLGVYMLSHLDQAVMTGADDLVARFKDQSELGRFKVGLDYQVLGLDTRPSYFLELAVSGPQFLRLEGLIATKTDNLNQCCQEHTPYCLACNAQEDVGTYCRKHPDNCPGFTYASDASGSGVSPHSLSYLNAMAAASRAVLTK